MCNTSCVPEVFHLEPTGLSLLQYIVLLLVGLCLYDIIAVFITPYFTKVGRGREGGGGGEERRRRGGERRRGRGEGGERRGWERGKKGGTYNTTEAGGVKLLIGQNNFVKPFGLFYF